MGWERKATAAGRLGLATAATLFAALAPATGAHAAPANDDFSRATTIPRLPALKKGSVAGATRERSEPDHARVSGRQTVWYRFRARGNGSVSLTTCSATFDTVIAVYSGSAIRRLRTVASNDNSCPNNKGSALEFAAERDGIYSIAVAVRRRAAVGRGTFELVAVALGRPPSDSFRRALTVRLGQRRIIATNRATIEPGEPDHADLAGPLHSVWFRLATSRTRRVTIDTFASGYDTVLAVYRGRTVGSLREVVSNDDVPRRAADTGEHAQARKKTYASKVTFVAKRGVTYSIALDGFEGASGPGVVRFSG